MDDAHGAQEMIGKCQRGSTAIEEVYIGATREAQAQCVLDWGAASSARKRTGGEVTDRLWFSYVTLDYLRCDP